MKLFTPLFRCPQCGEEVVWDVAWQLFWADVAIAALLDGMDRIWDTAGEPEPLQITREYIPRAERGYQFSVEVRGPRD